MALDVTGETVVNDEKEAGLMSFDFHHVFPHKTWISTWKEDESYPAGFRYKVMSAHDRVANTMELLVILQQRDGLKEVLKHLDVNAEAFDRYATIFVDGLTELYEIEFEEQDFRNCSTAEEFEALAERFGWYEPDSRSDT